MAATLDDILDAIIGLSEAIRPGVEALQELAAADNVAAGAATAPESGASASTSSGGSTGEDERKERERRASALRRDALNVGLETIEAMADPFQSRIIAGAEAAQRGGVLTAAALGNALAGDAGSEIAASAARTGFAATGVGANITALKQAQGDLFSRVAGASDAGISFSDDQLEELAAAEIGRRQTQKRELGRARNAFDAAAAAAGFAGLGADAKDASAAVQKEQLETLKEISTTLRESSGAPSLRSQG